MKIGQVVAIKKNLHAKISASWLSNPTYQILIPELLTDLIILTDIFFIVKKRIVMKISFISERKGKNNLIGS